jgi:3-phytase
VKSRWLLLATFVAPFTLAATPTIPSDVDTAPFVSYDDAPGTVDADDPAIWVQRDRPGESLVIATLKDAGLVVYDLRGRTLQFLAPPNLPTISPQDPPTPAGINSDARPCKESEGTSFGRFNNVDIAYGVQLGHKRRDLAIVTDRGCDRLRIYSIEPNRPQGPLVDITARNTPRLFPWRVVQPSPLQPGELEAGLQDNPIDDQDTGYGVGLWQDGDDLYAFVSQRNRSAVQQVKLVADAEGRISYRPVRAFLFDTSFRLKPRKGAAFSWTPCREGANEDPQSEGILIDAENKQLYVAFETVGVYRIPLTRNLPPALKVGREYLFEPVKSFGKPYWATPDDDEFECTYEPEGTPEDGTLVAAGSDAFAGENLEADVEGLAIYATGKHAGYLVVSSQGDNTFHVYDRQKNNPHLGTFMIGNTGDSDGVAITSASLGRNFPAGIVAVQNGEAEDPPDTGDINGYEYDGSTQFRFVDWRKVAKALRLR